MPRWMPWIVGIASVAAVVFAALHFSETRDFARVAEQANGWWLLGAVGLQAATYLAQGQVLGCVVRAGGSSLSMKTLYELSLAKLFVEQAIPSAGLSGTAIVVGVLEREGVPRALISTAVIVDLVSCWAAYALGLVAALVLVLVRGQTNPFIVGISGLFIVGLGLLTWMGARIAGRRPGRFAEKLKGLKLVAKVMNFIADADPQLSRSPRVLAETIGYQLAILVLDAATIGVLLPALGASADAGGVFASFMISTLFRTVESVPGGLGVFEASSVFTLKLIGVPVAVALSATLLFRGLSFWLPMIPGLWLSHRLTRRTPSSSGSR
jgi:Mg2+-importing ATPase